jgi:two-component sensor histidine kinase
MDAALALKDNMSHNAPSDLAAEANHRIANSLTLLVSMVRMQAGATMKRGEPLAPADVRHILDGVAARISTIGQLHRLLSHVPASGMTNLAPHLRDVSDALVAALASPEQRVRVEHSGSGCLVPTRQVQPLVLILCEVFINAMKYAHPAGAPLIMTVDCAPLPDGRLMLNIADDGVGLPDGFDGSRDGGLGFRVIRSLVAEVGGQLEVISGDLGLSFRIVLPAQPGGKLS